MAHGSFPFHLFTAIRCEPAISLWLPTRAYPSTTVFINFDGRLTYSSPSHRNPPRWITLGCPPSTSSEATSQLDADRNSVVTTIFDCFKFIDPATGPPSTAGQPFGHTKAYLGPSTSFCLSRGPVTGRSLPVHRPLLGAAS